MNGACHCLIFMEFPAFRFGRFTQGPRYRTVRTAGSGDYLVIATLGGAGIVRRGRAERVVGPTEALLYAPGAPQDYGTDPETGRWELAWAHFQPRAHWLPWLRWPTWRGGTGVLSLPTAEVRENFLKSVNAMVVAARRPAATAVEFALNRLEEALLWADLEVRRDDTLRIDPRIRASMDYLSGEPSRPFDLEPTARAAGLSVTRFSHLFKEATGTTPQQYSEAARLAHASFLLRESTLRINEVAAQCGFADPLYFSRRFRRRFGHPPTRHRGTD
ncbi:MAG: helix-turn-helix domain-containing protein [Opitutales bacterium]|nr:helix-turn-helix domain-containing protein [Opitutales bacterium]